MYFGGYAENMAENLKDCCVPCKITWDELEGLCRLEKLYCQELNVNRANVNDYEVEFLCDYKRNKGEEFYFVKWKGFPESDNTWEPKRNLKCPKLMKLFHLDLDQVLKRQKRRGLPKSLDREAALILVQKAKHRQRLRQWEAHLNKTRNHPGRIFVTNDVDLDGPPKHFTYINNYKVGPGIVLNEMAVGCECKDCQKEPVKGCCPGASLHRMAYNDKGQVRIRPGEPIYECNSRCNCGPGCSNRVVQKGIQFDLCIFKTENGRGWGVRTLQHIKKNTFVMEYVGEIITTDEAERRGHFYDCQGSTYLFDLDYVEDVYTVDAAHLGNISHFVNHSCNPNLQVFNVFVDNIDERLPRIALFSTRSIRAGEELTFDYKMQIDPVDTESTKMDSSFSLAGLPASPKKRIRVECRCGSESCRKYLF
ncbi:histone-lysine N-methyltransferase SUV39H1 isoform X1 [Fundulus heteroclitus]|uniref:histone-lysine N-methyltransferase SUV39H1 isoform X1 n=1 Tax=Fundulus heteroclitus TaxID=8078 RepID=UPI00165C0803|nr:histone-lysine N-methyltransferase SUV39H1 isoform X1 [Fundulus heteroclitus]